MIPRLRPPFTLTDLLAAWHASGRDDGSAFEQAFAREFGFEHGLFFPMGRSALFALLKALEWTGREIVVPAYTCAVVPHAIVVSGNRPRFIDPPLDHFNVLPQDLERNLSPTTAMVIPTPVFGFPVDDAGYQDVCRRRAPGALVVYDLAHGFGCQGDGPGLRRADGAIFGLGIGKILSTLSGGMLLLRDPALAATVRAYRDRRFQRPAWGAELARLVYGGATWAAFRNPLLGLTDLLERRTRLLAPFTEHFYGKDGPSLVPEAFVLPSAVQANLGLRQLERYHALAASRRDTARRYQDLLGRKGVRTFPARPGATFSQFPLLVRDRRTAVAALRAKGIQAGVLIDYACPDLPGYEDFRGSCPNAARYGAGMINLPDWPGLPGPAIERIAAAVDEAWNA
jgi:dTDP-4-amino-4,6-dideoxygalactose transaminase